MKRRLGIALVALLVAVGVIAGVALAQLTDTRTASGTINATSTSPDLYICEPGSTPGPACGSDDSGADEIVFETVESIGAGETVTWDIRLRNVGTAPWRVTGYSTSQVEVTDPGNDCSLSQLNLTWGGTTILGKGGDEYNDNDEVGLRFPRESSQHLRSSDLAVVVAPGDYEDMRLRVQMPATNAEGCDGNEWNISFTYEVTTSS